MTKKTGLKPITEDHELIIDEYFNNGFNKAKAVLAIKQELNPTAANAVFSAIWKNPTLQPYIEEKRARLKASSDIQNEHVVRELINIGYSDITDVIGLTMDQLKALPPETRRCIASIKRREHTDKHGNYQGETIEIKMKDSMKALELIAKHLNLFEADNKSKGNNINVLQVLQKQNPDTLNNLLKAIESK